MYLDNLRNSSPEAGLISLADKYHNARSIEQEIFVHGEQVWNKYFGYERTLWFYQELIVIYRDKGFHENWLFLELEKTIKRMFDSDKRLFI
jgi:GTP pyrophosphokinase